MAKTNITQYSTTPSSNTDINSINIDENCPASGLNNAIRELMAHLKNVDTGSQALTALSVTGALSCGAFTSNGIDDNADATAITIDSSENVGIGITVPTVKLDIVDDGVQLRLANSTTGTTTSDGSRIQLSGNDLLLVNRESANMQFYTADAERMRIDSSGTVNINTTSQLITTNEKLRVSGGKASFSVAGDSGINVERTSDDGALARFYRSGTLVGNIGSKSGSLFIGSIEGSDAFLAFANNTVFPSAHEGSFRDNAIDLGDASSRFDDIRATNGTIQTSDQQEKNTITDSDLGIDFIKRLTPKSYIFNGKTRTHYGLIAQDVETVLSDISKPTSGFAGFIKDDISEEQDGSQYRYGLRYTEFVAPLIQAVKDQQAIIEDLQARITALENA